MHCLVSCLHYSELLLWRIFDSWSANDILSEIDSLIEMLPKKSKLVRKRLSKCNAAHRWSAKKVDFAAVIDGKSNFAEANDTATDTDSAGKTATADTGATAQLPGVK